MILDHKNNQYYSLAKVVCILTHILIPSFSIWGWGYIPIATCTGVRRGGGGGGSTAPQHTCIYIICNLFFWKMSKNRHFEMYYSSRKIIIQIPSLGSTPQTRTPVHACGYIHVHVQLSICNCTVHIVENGPATPLPKWNFRNFHR